MKKLLPLFVVLGILPLVFAETPENTGSPYGTCAHLAGGQEHLAMPQNLNAMHAAGIRWARADFSWSGVERPQGEWHFEHLDRMLDEADKAGITVLPILDYSTAWAKPTIQHLDLWEEYVRRVVTRYQDRIRYWEVWNEENLEHFWGKKPDAAEYATLLKRTYQIIKEIDPDLQVVYGGLAGVPAKYFEETLQAGAGAYFDVMNIHPYRGGMTTFESVTQFQRDIEQFRTLMNQYGVPQKPIWITEMGWATPPALGATTKGILSASLKILFPEGITKKVAVLHDPAFPPSLRWMDGDWQNLLPQGMAFSRFSLNDLENLNEREFPVLLLPPDEAFPAEKADAIFRYVCRGGTLCLLSGVPMYYHYEKDADGTLVRKGSSEDIRKKFQIGWQAWWNAPNTPEKAPLKITSDALKLRKIPEGNRFLTESRLRPGDRMIPLLVADTETFSLPAAAIYRFDNDVSHGNIVVSTVLNDVPLNTNRCVPENQGVFLAQSMLLAYQFGVERYFNYEFQSVERDDVDPEHHFGITHADLTPKTGYLAYRALTQARPAGSVQISKTWREGDLCKVSWKRPDGRVGVALWVPSGEARFVGNPNEIAEAFDVLGNPVTVTPEMTVTRNILYLIYSSH
ncbi:MAG: beta-galactosidase [Planctomycetia bacterium]|nr:beta-galactosidase [Planctomycetia bacterium]